MIAASGNGSGRRLQCFVLGALAALLLLAFALAPAAQASKGPVGWFGSDKGRPGEEGYGYGAGEIHSVGGLSINSIGAGQGVEPGDIFLIDRGRDSSSRIDQFGANGNFIRAFGWDIVSQGQHNTGENGQQTVTIPSSVTGGTFKLSVRSGVGLGRENFGSNEITELAMELGEFHVGDVLTFQYGFPAGTKIVAIEGTRLILSNKASNGGIAEIVGSETTGPINYNASASSGSGGANLQARLEALPAIGAGNVSVTGGPGGSGTPFTVTFTGGAFAHNLVPQMGIINSLAGGSGSIDVVAGGGGVEVCDSVSSPLDVCRSSSVPAEGEGAAGAMSPAGIEVDQATGNIFISESSNRRVSIFGPDGHFQGAFGWGVSTGASELQFCVATCQQGSAGGGAGQFGPGFGSPSALTIDEATGSLIVGDTSNARIQEFSLTENGATEVTGATFERTYGWNVVASGPDDTGTGFEECKPPVNPADICQAGTEGSGLGQITFISSLDSSSTGVIYSTENFQRVQRFTQTGATITPDIFAPAILTGSVGQLSVGPNDHVFTIIHTPPGATAECPDGLPSQQESRVIEVDAGGAYQDTHGICTQTPNRFGGYSFFGGLGVNKVSGDMFFPDDNGNSFGRPDHGGVVIFGQSDPPDTAIDTVTPNTSGATINGSVNPNGPSSGYPHAPTTTYQAEYRRAIDPTWTPFGRPVDIGGGFSDRDITIHLGALDANTNYEVRLVGAKPGTPNGITPPVAFKTLPVPPTIDAFSSSEVAEASAKLHALINAHGTDTTYHFEYGTTVEYGSETPATSLGESLDPQQVEVPITGLIPTVYHFRVVAENAIGTVTSVDQTFTFFPPSCPNSKLRQQNNSDYLPDCRSYEIVTPGDAGNVVLEPAQWIPAPYATEPTRFGFGGKWGSVVGTNPTNSSVDTYVATRTSSGWTTTYPGIPGNQSPTTMFGAADLGLNTVLDFQGGGGYLGGGNSIPSEGPWIWDVSGAFVGRWPDELNTIPGADQLNGAFQPSPDFSHLAFSSNNVDFDPQGQGLTTVPGSAYDYDTETGSITLISRTGAGGGIDIPQDPNNSEELKEFIRFPGQSPLGGPYLTDRRPAVLNPGVSTDGSHILMSTKGAECTPFERCPLHLYMRVDDAVTYEIPPGHAVEYVGKTADASKVYFISAAQLATTSGPQDTDHSADLYMWEESAGGPELVLLSSGAGGAGNSDDCTAAWTTDCGVTPVISNITRASDYPIATQSGDVFFYSPELLDGPENGVEEAQNLYLYRNGEVSFVASMNANGTEGLQRIQFSPDGEKAAFITTEQLTTFDNDGHAEMYAYDTSAGSLRCVSCRPDGGPALSDVAASDSGFFMSNDGRTFFTTGDPLVPKDTNNGADVYEFVEGQPQLISSGTGETHTDPITGDIVGTSLSGVSADGINVYFSTTETLVDQDHNGAYMKFYDARTGGGFPSEPISAPCEAADECHGTTSAVPGPAPIISNTNLGAGGNVVKSKRPKRKRGNHKHSHRGKRRGHRNSNGKPRRGGSRNGAGR